MKIRFFIVCSILILVSNPVAALASATPGLFADPKTLSVSGMAPLVPMVFMEGDRTGMEVMPFYAAYSFDFGEMNGYGASLSLKREMSRRWGVEAVISYAESESIDYTGANVYGVTFENGSLESFSAGVVLNFDTLRLENISFPVFIGLGTGWGSYKTTAHTGTWGDVRIESSSDDRFAAIWGTSIALKISQYFYINPSVIAMYSKGSDYVVRDGGGNVVFQSEPETRIATDFLFTVKHIPANLSYTYQYTLGLEGSDLSIHSLRYSIAF